MDIPVWFPVVSTSLLCCRVARSVLIYTLALPFPSLSDAPTVRHGEDDRERMRVWTASLSFTECKWDPISIFGAKRATFTDKIPTFDKMLTGILCFHLEWSTQCQPVVVPDCWHTVPPTHTHTLTHLHNTHWNQCRMFSLWLSQDTLYRIAADSEELQRHSGRTGHSVTFQRASEAGLNEPEWKPR